MKMTTEIPHEFRYRTEDFRLEEIEGQFVPTDQEREIIAGLKASSPIILEGSRGTGKSFLMRMAEIELNKSFSQDRVVPVYLSFLRSSLVHTSDVQQFHNWMLARLCSAILKSLRIKGLLVPTSLPFQILAGGVVSLDGSTPSALEKLSQEYESSYLIPGAHLPAGQIPDVQRFKDAIEEICQELNITRFCVLFDEAIHIFRPEQQRQFFTLFRDLRSPYLGCNAAVYPGVTSYGPVFELTHDATRKRIDRDVMSRRYLDQMRDIAFKQADANLATAIEKNGQNFAVLGYAVSGNPRILLKTLAQSKGMRTSDVNETIKTYYRSAIWSEHSGLAESYSGHRPFIDWGRSFLETVVLPETKAKNDRRQAEGQTESTCFFWVHRDTPEVIKHALRLLEYTGIVQKGDDGIRGTRSELGTRYAVNLGCLFALEATPTATALELVKHLSIKRFTEFGANHPSYSELVQAAPNYQEPDMLLILQEQLGKSIDCLDITDYQNEKLKECGLDTVDHVLRASEQDLIERIDYVGEKRARRIKNAAEAAVLEYLSG
jgi:hypothetical protein